jgi:bifunctional DNA-binding transcriptional regulator/antitoxin component of YhaV-PrlF toxin-antitoxin module
MTVTVKNKTPLIVPQAIQRMAGIKAGDRLEVKASARTITITAVGQTYKPTKAEWAAIRRGEAALARGESVSLTEFANDWDSHRCKASPKSSRKVSR